MPDRHAALRGRIADRADCEGAAYSPGVARGAGWDGAVTVVGAGDAAAGQGAGWAAGDRGGAEGVVGGIGVRGSIIRELERCNTMEPRGGFLLAQVVSRSVYGNSFSANPSPSWTWAT